MKLLSTSLLNGIAVLVRTAISFILNKILAVYVGPSGYAAIGQFQNFIQIIISFAGGAIHTAVVKYTAEYYDDERRQILVWQTAGTIVLLFSLLLTVIILVFQKPLSIYLFQSLAYQSVFVWFALSLIFFTFNTLFLAILNGKKEIKKLVVASISGSVFSLVVTAILVIKYQLLGALIALSVYQSISFLVTFALCLRSPWFKVAYLFGKINKKVSRNFLNYAAMALVSAMCVPVSQILIRNHVISKFGVDYAGYWDAMTRLSGGYLMLVTTTFGVYYLPRLSEIKDKHEVIAEVILGYKFILPFAIISSTLVYIFRFEIITILFTRSFFPMDEIFLWQLIGDVLKIGSWILAYLMLGRAMTKLFIITEILFTISLLVLTYLFSKYFAFEGVAIAYMVNYAIYWVLMGFVVFRAI